MGPTLEASSLPAENRIQQGFTGGCCLRWYGVVHNICG